jgi:hypothetical protein
MDRRIEVGVQFLEIGSGERAQAGFDFAALRLIISVGTIYVLDRLFTRSPKRLHRFSANLIPSSSRFARLRSSLRLAFFDRLQNSFRSKIIYLGGELPTRLRSLL